MINTVSASNLKPKEFYRELLSETEAILVASWVSNLANVSAMLMHSLEGLNWVGFYLVENKSNLILGPFQGRPACLSIPVGQGVCGRAAESGQSQMVDDVHLFPGHIACDAASRSELVIPISAGQRLIGVLDLDSPHLARFKKGFLKNIYGPVLRPVICQACDRARFSELQAS